MMTPLRSGRHRRLLPGCLISLAAALLLVSGCGSEPEDQPPAQRKQATKEIPERPDRPDRHPDSEAPDAGAPTEPTPPPVVDITPQQEDRVSLLSESILDFLESKFAKDTIFLSRYRETFERQIRDSKHFISLMREVYTGRKFSPLFFSYDDKVPALTPNGEALRDLIVDIESHGLKGKDYRIPELKKALDAVEPLKEEYLKTRSALPDERTQRLWKLVEGYTTIPSETTLKAVLVAQGFSNDDAKLVRELARFYPNLLQRKKELNQAIQQADILLVRGFFQFLLDFRYVLRAHPFKVTPEVSLAHVKFREELRDDFQKADPDFAGYLQKLIPQNPTYERLRKGLAHYRRLRDEGEIDKIRIKRNLKKGHRGAHVRELTRRLILEGYLDADQESDVFGSQVQAGVKLYQRKHQLRVSGRTDGTTRGSMNVSMGRRVQQIELSLQRWRESAITRDKPDFYFRVNIPQFELEVWEGTKRLRVHRIVVGNRKEEVSIERKQRGTFNHTPLLNKMVSTVVLNPLWFPPPRLQKELLEDMVREPDFFEKHNYGIKMSDSGEEIIFQKPGPENALGLVKFLFPNEHHVYLHDTPKKALFDRPIRSYSHGCMRLDKPLDLAEFLLGRINGMDRRDIDKILETEKEHYLKLEEPVPIYVEYNAVGADEEGWVHFYIDIYKYDKAYWENRLPVELAEDLTSSEVKRLTKGGGGAEAVPAGLDEFDDPDAEDGVVPSP